MYLIRMCSAGGRGFCCNQMVVGLSYGVHVGNAFSMCIDFETSWESGPTTSIGFGHGSGCMNLPGPTTDLT